MAAIEGLLPSSSYRLILVLHMLATSVMVGVIWFVQHVHYPLKRFVEEAAFVDYERQHIDRTGHVVGVPMLAEAALAVLLVIDPTIHGQPAIAWLGFVLLVLIWMSTAVFQVPQHHILSSGFDRRAHRRLVNSNWVRTVLWTARGILSVILLLGA